MLEGVSLVETIRHTSLKSQLWSIGMKAQPPFSFPFLPAQD